MNLTMVCLAYLMISLPLETIQPRLPPLLPHGRNSDDRTKGGQTENPNPLSKTTGGSTEK